MSLRNLALKGSAYEIASFGIGQGLRFASNLLLTRLLFPEAFGLATLVTVVNQGLTMLSDVGVAPSVVQHPEGDDPKFLNTAWTLQTVRGVTLFVIGVALAWPISLFYGKPELFWLLCVGNLGPLIGGLTSTAMLTLKRQVDRRRILFVDLTAQVVGIAATVLAAWVTRSVWALVLGGLIGPIIRTLLSHTLINVGYRNRFGWSKEAAQAIGRFGRWIFFSSAVQFVAQQADRAYLGKVLGFEELGVYTVAITLAELGGTVVVRLTHEILFPILSRVHRERPQHLSAAYYRARLAMDALVVPAAGALCVLAPALIDFLYDDRYEAAGWMLQISSIRVAIAAIVAPSENCLFSMGHSRYGFMRSALRMGWMIIGLPLGFHYYGLIGLVWVGALSSLPAAVALNISLARHGILKWHREALVPLFFGLGAAVASLF